MPSYPIIPPKGKYRIVLIKDTPKQSSRNCSEILECDLCEKEFVEQSPIQRKGKCGSCILQIKCSNCGEFKPHKKDSLSKKAVPWSSTPTQIRKLGDISGKRAISKKA